MKRAAVILGVNRCGPLPVLRGAVSGARRVAGWARQNGFEVVSLTDSEEAPLKATHIFDSVDEFVRRHNLKTLFLYFAGHGVLLAPDCEYWLLASADRNPNEAVNIPGSIEAARNSGIEHIVFISDACRSKPTFDWQTSVKGTVIFPNQRPRTPRPAIDRLFATLPGNPALELDVNTAARMYDGVFTGCLLQILNAEIEEIIDEFDSPPPPIRVIQCFRAGEYLQTEVPRRLASVDPALSQTPDFIAESHRPKYLAVVARPESLEALVSPAPASPLTQVAQMSDSYNLSHYFGPPAAPSTHIITPASTRSFDDEIARVRATQGRGTFETRVGFSILGIPIERVATSGRTDTFEERGAYHIRVHNENARTALIQFANGSGVALPVLSGFVGTVLVEDDDVLSIAYAPVLETPRRYDYDASEVEKRRAFASVATSHGYFRVDVSNAARFAGYVRELKSFDPILGLFAAYAYSQAGLRENVDDVYAFMSREDVPILFDLAMLVDRWDKPVAPFCPLLRQSWAVRAARNTPTSELLDFCASYLRPGLWTSFNRTGMESLFSAF
ncbi:MAG: caspase family protein, partial [Bryobacteraceae bacterium]